jgi:glutathione synthase/RimK-type ligase-like ATP-grasp enzyme
MKPGILLFTISSDIHADRILSLGSQDAPMIRLDLDRPDKWTLSFQNGDVRITTPEIVLGLDEVQSVFVRRIPNIDAFKRTVHESVSEYADYIAQQSFFLFSDCLAVLDANTRFVNPLASASKIGKAVQANIARAVGFSTPRTYIGSNPDTASRFCEEIFASGGRPCVKPIVNSKVNISGVPHTQFTSTLELNDLTQIESLALCPTIFQIYVPKAYEVRATVVGDRVFAARIESQQAGGGTATDWRRYNIPQTPHFAIELPDEVLHRTLELQRRLGLIYSAFDFIVTPDEEYVFLETNPYGQWLWIEDLTGLPISRAIADFLSGPGSG